ncbi:hypothetical protein [Nocardioides zeae]|uniref:Lipoprotein n=1 Tax=Nocardioides zeae TaxID=1457234 RepID=A0A6P0HNT2_9ACTN|nr:hypothetical protein [Nocardioides zeae]NEN80298.1 hypothetical protein [Nocardioides zeae]
MNKKLLAPTLFAAAFILAGCGSETTSTTTAAAAGSTPSAADDCGGGVQPALVRGNRYFDYDVIPNLTASVAKWEVAVTGRVIGWTEGRSVYDVEHVERYATVAIEVETAAKVEDPSQRDVAYFDVSLGSDTINAEGIAADNKPTPEELERAIPLGTRMIAIGNTAPTPEEERYAPSIRIEGYEAGRPAGAPLASLTVQGSLVETKNGCTASIRAQDQDVSYWTAHAAELAGNEATAATSPGSFQNLVDELSNYKPN